MGIVSSTVWAARMDRAVHKQDEDAIVALVDEQLAYDEYRDRGERRVGRWWSALTGGTPDVNDLEDHQLTPAQLQQRNAARQMRRQSMLDAFLDDLEEYVPDGR